MTPNELDELPAKTDVEPLSLTAGEQSALFEPLDKHGAHAAAPARQSTAGCLAARNLESGVPAGSSS